MGITLANNAKSTLSAAATSTDTVLYVTDVSSFPALGAGDYFNATLESTSGAYEIVRVTQINAASLNVTRGQEDTIAIPFSSGARIELRPTVQNLTDFLLTASNVNDDAYSAAWNGDVEDAPSRNALYDKIETLLPSASYTAADVLAKLLTVDGIGSGLDADSVHGVDGPNIVIRSGGVVSMVNDTDITLGKTTTGSPTGLTIRYNATGGNGFVAWQDDGGALWKALVTSSDAWQLYNSALSANAISVASATSNVTFAGTVTVPDDAYAAGWDGNLTVPTKNAVYDKIQSIAGLTDGDKGDITVSASGATWTIDNNAVTLAKIADIGTSGATIPRNDTANTFSAAQTITVATATPLTLTMSDSGATGGPYLYATRYSVSPAAADLIGGLVFRGYDSAAAATDYAYFQAAISDPTNGSEDGQLSLYGLVAGTSTELTRWLNGQALFPAGAAATPALSGISDTDTGFTFDGSNVIGIVTGGTKRTTITTAAYLDEANGTMTLGGNGQKRWGDVNLASGKQITFNSGNAGATSLVHTTSALEHRLTTTAQSFRVFNTWTDASNYERGVFDWGMSANVLSIGTDKLGTGSTRNLRFLVGGTNQLDYGITNASKWTAASDVITPAGKEQVWVPAAAMKPRTTSGCAALATTETTTNKVNLETLDFDASTAEYAQFTLRIPKRWGTSTFTAKFYWKHAATATNFATVWGIQAGAFGDNEALDTAFGTAQTVTDTGGTTNNNYISAATSAVTIANVTAEELVYFQVYRDATAGGDTLAIDAGLIGVMLEFTTTGALNDN